MIKYLVILLILCNNNALAHYSQREQEDNFRRQRSLDQAQFDRDIDATRWTRESY